MNLIARLEFELADDYVTVQHVGLYAMKNPQKSFLSNFVQEEEAK